MTTSPVIIMDRLSPPEGRCQHQLPPVISCTFFWPLDYG